MPHDAAVPDTAREVVELLRGRRTIPHGCLDPERTVDHELVRQAVASAVWAPNHHRTEPWRFVLLDRHRIDRLGAMFAAFLQRSGSPPRRVDAKRAEWGRAPGVMVLLCAQDADAGEVRRREDYAACCCAAQNFMLHLWAYGIGCKWSTGAVWEHEDFWTTLGVEEDAQVVGIFFYGHPTSVPEGRRSLDVDQVVIDHVRAADATARAG